MRQWWVVPGPDGGVTELRKVERPTAGDGEVVVDIAGAAINRGELIGRRAMRSDNPQARPRPSGIEFAGVVAEVGAGVQGWTTGDRVMGRGAACHADAAVVDVEALMRVPAQMEFTAAAAIPNVFVTAHDALVTTAALRPGESVLITAGSSGVGTAAIQLARVLGAEHVIATSRSPNKRSALLDLGATHVVNTGSDGWPNEVRDIVGGIDVVVDQAGGDVFMPCLETMSLCGRYVTVGRNAGNHASINLDLVARLRLTLHGVTFRTRTKKESLECGRRFAEHFLAAFDDRSLRPILDRTFPFEELPAAHQYMETDAQIGKIVLVP